MTSQGHIRHNAFLSQVPKASNDVLVICKLNRKGERWFSFDRLIRRAFQFNNFCNQAYTKSNTGKGIGLNSKARGGDAVVRGPVSLHWSSLRSFPLPIIPLCLSREEGRYFFPSGAKETEKQKNNNDNNNA